MNLLEIMGLGLLLGLRHAADPDHVVAVGAITARTGRVGGAAWLGAVWGIGHTLTLFGVGAAIILFNLVVPPRVGLALELAVGVVLVVVGLLNFNRPHRHDDDLSAGGRIPAWRAFAVGTVHGLAGSAAVALLVLATVRDPWWACGYLLVFGAGTLLGMSLITVSLAAPLAAVRRRWDPRGRVLRFATGAVSVAFGAWLIYHIGWHDGLFLAVPRWTPH